MGESYILLFTQKNLLKSFVFMVGIGHSFIPIFFPEANFCPLAKVLR